MFEKPQRSAIPHTQAANMPWKTGLHGGANALTATKACEQETQYQSAYRVMADRVERLDNLITRLQSRIQPVVRNEPAQPKDEKTPNVEYSVPMAVDLQTLSDRLGGTCNQLDYLLNILDLP